MKPKIKIRVALAVAPNGEWNAVGWSCASDETMMAIAVEQVPDGERRYWLETEVEAPDPQADVIQVEVKEA